MAVTSIWPISRNPSVVIDYARNPEKTVEKGAEAMAALHKISGVIEYAADEIKTERRSYVTCINCNSEETAAQEFMEVKDFWKKTDGRQCFHGYQSFKSDEVDAETAHAIGVELATKLWGEDFQVVVATHCNTGHYHNHFVLNSVSVTDGHHFDNTQADYQAMREMSDALCRKYRLSVIENPSGRGKNYGEYAAEKNGKPTYRSMIREDIDRAIAASVTREEFFTFLEGAGYELKLYKQDGDWLEHPALKPLGAKGFFRFHKLGPGYDLDEIDKRIRKNLYGEFPFQEEEQDQVNHYRVENPPPVYQRKMPYLYGLYLRYCYELHIIESHPASVQRVSFFMREDLTKLDRLDAETRLLGKYQIANYEDMQKHKAELSGRVAELEAKRSELRNQMRCLKRQHDPIQAEAVKGQISDITKQLRELRKEMSLCEDIELRSAQTREELEWLLDQQEIQHREEERDDELLRGSGGAGREDELGRR